MKKSIVKIVSALLLATTFVGCSSKAEEKKVVIASKPMTSQYVVVEMLAALIENNSDIKVEKKLGIGGGTSNIHPAIVKGEIDMYPEYTGTGWLAVLKRDLIKDPQELYNEVKKAYEEEFKLNWLDLYGYNDTYVVAIRPEVAKEKNIKTISDLSKYSSELIFGGNPDYIERQDGLNALSAEYNLNFKEVKQIDIALKYNAMESKEIDVSVFPSTEGRLKESDLVKLEDDKTFFTSYYATTVIRQETLDKYPELQDILNKLAGQISEEDIISMSYSVEVDKKDPKAVAIEFLKEKGLL